MKEGDKRPDWSHCKYSPLSSLGAFLEEEEEDEDEDEEKEEEFSLELYESIPVNHRSGGLIDEYATWTEGRTESTATDSTSSFFSFFSLFSFFSMFFFSIKFSVITFLHSVYVKRSDRMILQ